MFHLIKDLPVAAWTHDHTLKLNIQESCDIKLYAQLRSECIAKKHIFYENLNSHIKSQLPITLVNYFYEFQQRYSLNMQLWLDERELQTV